MVTATVPVGMAPQAAAVDPGTHTVYVTNADDNTVSVIDGSTRTAASDRFAVCIVAGLDYAGEPGPAGNQRLSAPPRRHPVLPG
jgi:DNA-binding beta-propeller fold protein YncE